MEIWFVLGFVVTLGLLCMAETATRMRKVRK